MSVQVEAPQGALNIWDFYDHSRAGEIPCESPHRFLQLLASKDTKSVERFSKFENTKEGEVFLYVVGPDTDHDAEEEGELWASHRFIRNEIHDGANNNEPLSGEEQKLLKSLLTDFKVKTRTSDGRVLDDTNGSATKEVFKRLGIK